MISSFQASEQIKSNTELQARQAEMQVQYDALLEMFGQKVRKTRKQRELHQQLKIFSL